MFSSVSGHFIHALESAKNGPSSIECNENDYGRNESTQRISFDTIVMFSSVTVLGHFDTA
jgi:hypothetical protein